MADDIESRVLRYKSRLQNCTDEEKLQETLLKIADIPITVDILQRTKIGKVVNGLRKRDGDLGFLARSIVSEWKSMVARLQSKEEEEEAPADKASSSPEIEANERSPTPDDEEEEVSNDGSSHNKKGSKEDKTHRHLSSHSSSHSSTDKINRHSSSKEHRSKNQEKSTEGRKENMGDSKKSSTSNKKQSQSESSSKSKAEQSESKSDRRGDTHKSYKSHSKTKDSKSKSESSNTKESKHHESKHLGNRHSSQNSSKDSNKSSFKDGSKDTENKQDKHGHSSHDSRKSESRHSGSDKKDKHHSRHRDQESDKSERHSNQSSSGSKSKKSSHSTENCDTGRQDKEHSSSRSDSKDLMRSKRPKHTLSESDSENSQEEKEEEGSSPSKMLGHWDGLSSDGEKNEESGGFFFNDEYVDHEALLDEALNKYHMEPLIPKPGSYSTDRKSVKRLSEDVKGDGHSDGSKRRKIENEAKKSSSDSGKKREDSKHRSHSSHKSKSSSSSKSSSHKNDKEDKKDKHNKEGKSRSKEPNSFEDSIAAVPVKKPKADPNYEKLKSKFKIKKKGEMSEKTKSEQKSQVDVSEGVKVPAPPPRLRLSQRELASLVRNNTVPNYRPIEETISAASQFDDSMIGQKSYAKTMVYSGKKNNVVPKVIPLQEICLNILANHIDSIEAVGSSVPYYLFEPVLKRCTAAQLYRIEDFNPHFLEETDQLWKMHCEREFKGSEPDEFETYRELYLRKYDEKERKFKQIKNNISQSMAKAVPERTAKLAYIDSYVKPPREVRRQQLKYGTAGPSTGERSKKFSHLMDPIALGRKERDEKAVKQKAPMMQKTMMMLKKMRR